MDETNNISENKVATVDDIRLIVDEVLVEHEKSHRPLYVEPKSYVTFTQGIIGIIVSVITMAGMIFTYMSGVEAKYQLHEQRIAKVEYQEQISIADRTDIRGMVVSQGSSISDIKATLGVINNKLDDIRQKQGK